MLGDMRVFDLGDELLLDCERVALQELFNMINRYKLGRDVELHKRTLQMGLLSVIGPDAPRAGRRQRARQRARELGGVQVVAVTTDVGTDLFFAAEDRDAVRGALDFPDGDEAAGRGRARRARPPALRRRPRRQRDPAGSGPERARGVVHQGLLRRPGDGRSALLPRQAEPPPAGPAPGRAGRAREPSSSSARRSSASSAPWSSRPSTGRSAWRSSGARPTRATRWPSTGRSALIVEVPFAR